MLVDEHHLHIHVNIDSFLTSFGSSRSDRLMAVSTSVSTSDPILVRFVTSCLSMAPFILICEGSDSAIGTSYILVEGRDMVCSELCICGVKE